jgi:drug/metabolite transporter (DMT)-like permease
MGSPPKTAPNERAVSESPESSEAAVRVSATRPAFVWIALLIVYIVWGSTYLGIAISVETLPPLLSGGTRFFTAGLVLATVLTVRRGPRALRVSRRQLAGAAAVGLLLLVGGNGMVVLAESLRVPSGIAALLVATVPLLVVVYRLATGDRPRIATLAGVLVGFAGLAALILSRGGGGGVVTIGGALLVVVAATSWATGSYFSRRLSVPPDPFVATVYEMVIGGAVLAAVGVVAGEPAKLAHTAVSGRSLLALGYLTVAGSLVAFTAYAWLLQHAPISLTATYAYVNPVVAVALGAWLLHELVTGWVLFGGGVIVLGVALVVSTERPRKALSV